jgi:hypothetical protein
MSTTGAIVPLRIQELIGGMEGAGLERFGQFTKLVKGGLEVLLLPPRTCIVLIKRHDKVSLFPNLSIAQHHVLRANADTFLMDVQDSVDLVNLS